MKNLHRLIDDFNSTSFNDDDIVHIAQITCSSGTISNSPDQIHNNINDLNRILTVLYAKIDELPKIVQKNDSVVDTFPAIREYCKSIIVQCISIQSKKQSKQLQPKILLETLKCLETVLYFESSVLHILFYGSCQLILVPNIMTCSVLMIFSIVSKLIVVLNTPPVV